MELFLIRHPAPEVPAGTCYGRSDIGLAGDPEDAAARLRAHLPAGIPVYTSPLRRCRSVAERLAPAAMLDARLAEMHFGEWEMRRWDEIERTAFDAWVADILNFAPPGGECAAEMLARVLAFVEDLHSAGSRHAAVVTHGGVLRVLIAHWLGIPPRRWPGLVFDFGGISKVELEGRRAKVAYLNR